MTEPVGECEGCLNTGWETILDHYGAKRAQRCTRCGYWDNLRGAAPGVPADEQTATLESYQVTKDNGEAVKHGQYFLDGVHPDLYLWGGVGTGKTKLACCLLNQIWKTKKAGVRFIRVPELLLRLQPGMDATDAVFQQVVDVPYLCLDDVGASNASDFARRMLQTIYDARVDRGHRTIWTSNLDLDELGTFLGQDARLPSRIVGRAKVVELDGKDWRIQKARSRASGSKPASKARK